MTAIGSIKTLKLAAAAAVAAASLAGCGGDKYQGKVYGGDECAYDKIEFMPKQQVFVTIFGQQIAGTYSVEKDRVIINANAQSTVMTPTKDGALDAGELMGTCVRLKT